MSAKVHVGADDDAAPAKTPPPPETTERCECCGLTEECTGAYVARIRGRYEGRWICGLCSEAVGEEILRSDRPITTGEALGRHMTFSRSFRPPSSPPQPNPKEHLISAMMRLLMRRIFDSPRGGPGGGGGNEDCGGGGGGDSRQPLGRPRSCCSS